MVGRYVSSRCKGHKFVHIILQKWVVNRLIAVEYFSVVDIQIARLILDRITRNKLFKLLDLSAIVVASGLLESDENVLLKCLVLRIQIHR